MVVTIRHLAALVACGFGCVLVGLDAQQTTPPQTPPVFRGAVDVIRLDVSVLDRNHHPVRGLTADDFTVIEEGKPQRLVAVTEIDATANDPAPTAWMRHVPPDVAANDLADRVGDGRVFAIMIDDFNLPWDANDIVMAARATGRYIIDGLGPSDVAAVMFPFDAGRTQDFTDDRAKLLAAIDRFEPHERPWGYADRTPTGAGPGGGDMPQRFSPVLMRSQCQRSQPTIPALHVLASRLATIPGGRKTLVLVSTGVPLPFAEARGCAGALNDEMQDVFRLAQRANINIYGVDPSGYRHYEDYLQNSIHTRGGLVPATLSPRGAADAARLGHDFLAITAEQTGARAVINTDDVESGIDQIFAEDGSYYLVGYQTSNRKPDGKFRHVQVKVSRPGVSVRTRSGYYAPRDDSLITPEAKNGPASVDLGLSGMMSPPGVPLRATAIPMALTATNGSRDVLVGVVLTARLPAPPGPIVETLTVTRNVYDANGHAGPPVQEKWPLTLQPSAGDELTYDVFYKLTLPPGRYQLRLNAHSTAIDRAGTVFADVEVPDFTRPPISLSGVALGTLPAPGTSRTDALAADLPIVPTSARDFSPNEAITAFVRAYQGGGSPVASVAMGVRILDVRDATVFETAGTLQPASFDTSRGAPFQVDMPLARLSHGPYLLSITATRAGDPPVRRDVVFKVR